MKIAYENKEGLKVVNLPNKNQVRDVDLNEIKESVNTLYDNTGWIEFRDTLNTESNRQTITAQQNNVITINKGVVLDDFAPDGGDLLYVDNKIQPIALGDAYMVRLDFTAAVNNEFAFIDFDLFIGGTIGTAIKRTFPLPKGANVPHTFSYTFLIYCLDTFVSNGGQLRLNPSHNGTIWDKRIIISKQ
jgi:hypothetical protein